MFFAARRWEMKNCLFVLILCAATSLFLDKSASATNLGVANDYNLFVLENLYGYNSDSWGNIATGGNAYLSSYNVAGTLNGNNARLVVGGNLIWEPGGGRVGQDGQGNIYAGGTTNIVPWATYNGPCLPQNVVDFAAARSYLNQASSAWSKQSTIGKFDSSSLNLTGTSDKLNVFNLSDLEVKKGSLNITAPAGSTVLVNVSGKDVTMQNAEISLDGGVTSNYVLFNFYEATSLTVTSYEFWGSILAPNAAINLTNGQFNGTLIGKSFGAPNTSCGQGHNYLFQGNLPDVPEPATLALLITGALVLTKMKKHRRV
jgi:choice-of-anchor A domain-containing protein